MIPRDWALLSSEEPSLWDQMVYSDSPNIPMGNSLVNGTRNTNAMNPVHKEEKPTLVPADDDGQKLVTHNFESQSGFIFEKSQEKALVLEDSPSMLSQMLGPTKKI